MGISISGSNAGTTSNIADVFTTGNVSNLSVID
jgi:hypothetical protein